jgi:hypothetical protein
MLNDIVVDCHNGVPILPVDPQHIFSTNESTQFVYEGCRSTEEMFKLITKDSCKGKETNKHTGWRKTMRCQECELSVHGHLVEEGHFPFFSHGVLFEW